MAMTLIAFFSRADENYFVGSMKYIEVGNTEVAVGKIKDRIDADVFKIEMKESYSSDYMTCIDEAKKHLRENAIPELISIPDSIDEYDTIILGYPNYWGTMPMAVFTFLDALNFDGKTILPLCTNEGSGMGHSESDIKKACSQAVVKKGLAISGSKVESSDSQIDSWLKTNGLI